MAKNNHLEENNQKKLDSLLRHSGSALPTDVYNLAIQYAESIAGIENCVAVVSNLVENRSRIIAGKFADLLNLGDYDNENSIWEKKILDLMTEEERQEKYIAELRFYHFLKRIVPSKRDEYYLLSQLRFRLQNKRFMDIQHRMYYMYDESKKNLIAAICLYSPLTFSHSGKSYAVNSITGIYEELTNSDSNTVLSQRECQVLSLIEKGMKSREIAETLNISIHTVNRHRQSILESLQVKNSHEACRIAKSMSLI